MTWTQLQEAAAADDLELHRTTGGVSVETTDMFKVPLVTITIGDLDEKDSDIVLRATLQRALEALRALPR